MTLIASYINKYGIVMMSDSNLTSKEGNAGFGQKIFPITKLNAAISYSGLYYINNKDLDEWLNDFIKNESHISNSIEEFVVNLKDRLNFEFNNINNSPTIMHICGYSKTENQSHVEHWHISNAGLQEGGDYLTNECFSHHEDFNSKNNVTHFELMQAFENHPSNHQFFINGLPPARICFSAIKNTLQELFVIFSKEQKWRFRPPKNIFETSSQLKMYFYIISEMFKMSDYEALFVGGEIQSYLIPVPSDIRK